MRCLGRDRLSNALFQIDTTMDLFTACLRSNVRDEWYHSIPSVCINPKAMKYDNVHYLFMVEQRTDGTIMKKENTKR